MALILHSCVALVQFVSDNSVVSEIVPEIHISLSEKWGSHTYLPGLI